VLRFLPYVLGLASISAVVWFIYDSGFDNGVEKTKIQYEEVIKEERKRIVSANKEALDKARQNIENLEARLEVRNAQIRQIVSEGYGTFYSGFFTNLMRITPHYAITFVLYEHFSHKFHELFDSKHD